VNPDLLLTNGVLWGRPQHSALAVKSDRIVAIGSDAELRQHAGPATRVIDARGRSVLPAFQDAHVHPLRGGLVMMRCNLHEASGQAALGAAITRYARANPNEPWIVGSGWEEAGPTGWIEKRFLDAIVPDRPVFLMSAGLHDAWLNSLALRLCGIDADTPNPPDGQIGRFEDGEPSGLLHEGAVRLAEQVAPEVSDAEHDVAMLKAQSHLHRLGITSWQDAWVSPVELATYQRLAGRGELTARVTAALWWDRLSGEEQIERLVAQRESSYLGRLKATSVKIMVDGTTGNFSASVLEPYLDEQGRPTCNCGMDFVEPALLATVVTRLDALGFQVHFHAIGEAAVRHALDAVEAARRTNGWSDLRHHIAHVCLVHPADIPRFAALDVTVNMQPYWAADTPDMVRESRFLGHPRSTWWYRFQTLRASGARLAGGSDWPVSTADPLRETHVAVNRVLPDTSGESYLPAERLPLGSALEAFLSGAAYVNHLDDATGDLTIGKLADIVVLDRDLAAAEPREVGDAKVLLTVLGGDAVHEDPGLETAS
jgi:hypothetical protein